MVFTHEEYADMHLVYGEMRCNARAAQRRYAEKFPNREHPTHSTFTALHQRLRETGSVVPKNNETGRHYNVTAAHEDVILMEVDENPEISVRRLSAMYPTISKSSIGNILHNENLYPFHFRKVQALLQGDFPAREEFARWLQNQKNENQDFFRYILFCDEATFTKNASFNVHNAHYYSYVGDNPHVVQEFKHQHRFSINVWIGVVDDYLLGPVELPARLNGADYLHFLQNILPDLLEDVSLNIRQNLWFLHDGCPAHFSRNVRDFLDTNYEDHWIGRGGPVAWPARSPDMNPCDYCVWGYIKSSVYSVPIQNRAQLWLRIQDACNEFRNNFGIFARIRRSLSKRVNLCIETNGHHIEHLL